jgi:hypothetical protein
MKCNTWEPIHVCVRCCFHMKGKLVLLGKGYVNFRCQGSQGKSSLSLISACQARRMISTNKKFILVFLRENQHNEGKMEVEASLDSCNKE